MKRLAFLSVLAITGLGCAVSHHKEVVQVPEPEVLTDPEIAEEAAGAKPFYQDVKAGKTEKTTFLSAGDSTIKVFSHGTETAVRPNQMTNARPAMSTSGVNPCVLVGSIVLGALIGLSVGWAVGRNFYKKFTHERPGGCAEIIFWPVIVMIGFSIALIVGIVVGVLVFVLTVILGNLIL
ncbi:MAG: hypothetical protein ABIN58_03035 [candidate division WOR-3 bacterium]